MSRAGRLNSRHYLRLVLFAYLLTGVSVVVVGAGQNVRVWRDGSAVRRGVGGRQAIQSQRHGQIIQSQAIHQSCLMLTCDIGRTDILCHVVLPQPISHHDDVDRL